MSLVKWIRKNNRKIMTFVVIFCMVAFVIGSFGLQMLTSFFGAGNRLIATYDGGDKIKQDTFMVASNELNVLKMLMADRLLIAQSRQSIAGPLLVKLIFPDSQFAGNIAGQLKQAVQQGQLQISTEELDAYFNQPTERAEILWILLRAEAYEAGCITSTETARETLRSVIPQMTQGQTDAARLVTRIIGESNITEEQIIRVFADLLSVLDYAGNVMGNQAVTLNQVKATLGRSKERIDADFVKIAAETFIDDKTDITDEQIQAQFDAFKDVLPGMTTDENPYGFGYKLPKRVQLEYILVKIEDVEAQTAKVTADEMERFYSQNVSQFQKEVPSDPSDPESEKKSVTQSYGEVENQIRQALVNQKTQTLANLFFNDIKDLADTGFGNIKVDDATVSELQMAAGDFEAIAQQISVKHKIAASVGKTGLLSADAFGRDEILSMMSMPYQRSTVNLFDLAFAVSESTEKTRHIGVPSLRVWQTIGPVSDGYRYGSRYGYHPSMMALVRIIDVEAEAIPENVNVAYDAKGIVLFASQKTDAVFSVKAQVTKDLILLSAMNTATARADELAALVADKGWDDAIKAYNEKYAKGDEKDDAAVQLDSFKQQTRISQVEIEAVKRMLRDNPAAARFMLPRLASSLLANKLYTMLPEDKETTGTIQTPMAFEPDASCYVVKEVIRQPATTADYAEGKARTAIQLSGMVTSELPLIHFSPENILKRMDYEYKMEQSDKTETDETESQDTEKKDEAA